LTVLSILYLYIFIQNRLGIPIQCLANNCLQFRSFGKGMPAMFKTPKFGNEYSPLRSLDLAAWTAADDGSGENLRIKTMASNRGEELRGERPKHRRKGLT
jgi:hypothetical protein